MSNLIINGFAGIGGRFASPIQALGSKTETQVVPINGFSAVSDATEDGSNVLRIYAEEDCSIEIGPDPVAHPDNGIPLTAKTWDVFVITPGHKVAVIARTVS